MRYPRVSSTPDSSAFGGNTPDEDEADSLPDFNSLCLVENDDEYQYGDTLSDIQTGDLAKFSFQRLLLPFRRSSQSTPLRRLSLELKSFLVDHPSYISVVPIGENLCNLLGCIEGPPGTPYEKGIFFIRFDCPDNYPLKPPVCNFITKIHHPNIANGRICVNILEAAWCPALTIETILLSICSLLADPFFDEALEERVAAEYKNNKALYESNARLSTRKYATGQRPTDEELVVAGQSNERLAKILETYRDT